MSNVLFITRKKNKLECHILNLIRRSLCKAMTRVWFIESERTSTQATSVKAHVQMHWWNGFVLQLATIKCRTMKGRWKIRDVAWGHEEGWVNYNTAESAVRKRDLHTPTHTPSARAEFLLNLWLTVCSNITGVHNSILRWTSSGSPHSFRLEMWKQTNPVLYC